MGTGGLFSLASALLALSLALAQSPGQAIYQARCAICHGERGQGVPGLYPPLSGPLGRLLALEEARAYMVWAVTYGLSGPISSSGATFNGLMPAQTGLSAAEIASLLNFLLDLNKGYIRGQIAYYSFAEVERYQAVRKTPKEVWRFREEMVARIRERGLPVP